MDFAGKIRSGRAFLNWTQEKLAEEAGLSFQGIQKIERGETQPTERTQGKIIKAFEKSGLLLTERGIEYQEYPIFFVEGDTEEACYLRVLEDVEEHLREQANPELLISFADDKVSPPAVNDFYKRLRAMGVQMRQLIKEDNDYIMGPLEEYRYIPSEFFVNCVTLVYGDRIASMTGGLKRAAIRVDNINADVQRNTFNLLWSLLKQPTKSAAYERF